MSTAGLSRFLELVQRELESSDARVELGGKDPTDPHLVHCVLPGGWRVVAVFDVPPSDHAEMTAHLERLVESFSAIATPDIEPLGKDSAPGRNLDAALELLADRAAAARVVVIDEKSPVIWGTSEPRPQHEDVDSAIDAVRAQHTLTRLDIDAAEILALPAEEWDAYLANAALTETDRQLALRELGHIRSSGPRAGAAAWKHYLIMAAAIDASRSRPTLEKTWVRREESFGFLIKPFAGMYRLILSFDHRFSELHADAAAVHALPVIEQLVMKLPPVDPSPNGARVRHLHTLRPV